MKICLVSSLGGHLQQLRALRPVLEEGHDYFFITFRSQEIAKGEKTYFVENPDLRNPRLGIVAAIVNFFQVLRILLRERPRVVISTGASVAIPVCYLAKLFGAKIIFIESMSRVSEPSLTGRIIYPIADLFLVQWESLMRHYRKAAYGGWLL